MDMIDIDPLRGPAASEAWVSEKREADRDILLELIALLDRELSDGLGHS